MIDIGEATDMHCTACADEGDVVSIQLGSKVIWLCDECSVSLAEKMMDAYEAKHGLDKS